MIRFHSFIFSLLFVIISMGVSAQAALIRGGNGPVYQVEEYLPWVDSVFNSLSTDERIGQLFMVAPSLD